jgi:hypothetical protein
MKDIKELTQDEMLEILCVPATTDEPEESDFEAVDDAAEEMFVKSWIEREMN